MRLLFITQKLHGQDAFGVLWARAFVAKGYDVSVICLEDRRDLTVTVLGDGPMPFKVYSMGKEKGYGKLRQVFRFWKLLLTLKYDRVFIHMSPVWGGLGSWIWIPKRTPVYLWYTHYKMQWGLRLLGWYGKRLFCATPQSLPQYPSTSSGQVRAKKVVTGHGIDLAYWPKRPNVADDSKKLLCVHRLSRSKRVQILLATMVLLPEYSLDIYGIDAEPAYAQNMRMLTEKLGLDDRVIFHGTVPSKDLPGIYARHKLILNMASETIDKSMLEAMTCGCYPVVTKANAEAIGIPAAPAKDTSESVAEFVKAHAAKAPIDADEMYRIVEQRHSLKSLIEQMDSFIRTGA